VVDAALDGVAAEEDDREDGALLVAVATVSSVGKSGEIIGNASDSDAGGDLDEAHESKEEDGEELHDGLEVFEEFESNRVSSARDAQNRLLRRRFSREVAI